MVTPGSAERDPARETATQEEALDLERAVGEVDRSLLRWSLGLTAGERLRIAVRNGRFLARLRRARD